MVENFKVGLALSGGAARGFAHIGVLKVFEEADINIDCLAGTSMGALIGALFASGMKAKVMDRIMRAAGTVSWLDFVLPRMGLIKGEKIEQIVHLLTRRSTFEQLKIPLAVVAVDLYSGKKVVLKKGLVCRAVRASISIPGFFVPLVSDNMLLVDGGVLDRVPVEVAREMDAKIVIAVDTGIYNRNTKFNSVLDVITRSFDIMQQEICRSQISNTDMIILPELGDIAPSQFERVGEAIDAGERAAREALPQLLALLEQRK